MLIRSKPFSIPVIQIQNVVHIEKVKPASNISDRDLNPSPRQTGQYTWDTDLNASPRWIGRYTRETDLHHSPNTPQKLLCTKPETLRTSILHNLYPAILTYSLAATFSLLKLGAQIVYSQSARVRGCVCVCVCVCTFKISLSGQYFALYTLFIYFPSTSTDPNQY